MLRTDQANIFCKAIEEFGSMNYNNFNNDRSFSKYVKNIKAVSFKS